MCSIKPRTEKHRVVKSVKREVGRFKGTIRLDNSQRVTQPVTYYRSTHQRRRGGGQASVRQRSYFQGTKGGNEVQSTTPCSLFPRVLWKYIYPPKIDRDREGKTRPFGEKNGRTVTVTGESVGTASGKRPWRLVELGSSRPVSKICMYVDHEKLA